MSLERLKERLDQIASRVPVVRGRGEEATKQALVLPMLDALGFDIWNPLEICPEFDADFATKKGSQKERVDLAVLLDGVPKVFIEVKSVDTSLDGHGGQLARYFNSVPTVCLALLTNGVEYRFFTDTGEPNLLDAQPFYTLRLDTIDHNLDVLSRFHKSLFSPTAIRDYATDLNYTWRILQVLRNELDLRNREPSEALVRWILSNEKLYEGRITVGVVERFRPIVKSALNVVLRDIVRRSVAALDEGVVAPRPVDPAVVAPEKASPTPTAASTSAPKVGVATPTRPAAAADKAVKVAPQAAPAVIVPSAQPEPPKLAPQEVSAAEADDKARIHTTEQELAVFAAVEKIFNASAFVHGTIFDAATRKDVQIELGHKDTTGYFGVYLNKPSWWVLRVVFSRTTWIGFNLQPETGARLVGPEQNVLQPTPAAPFRVEIQGAQDIPTLEALVLAAFSECVATREAMR